MSSKQNTADAIGQPARHKQRIHTKMIHYIVAPDHVEHEQCFSEFYVFLCSCVQFWAPVLVCMSDVGIVMGNATKLQQHAHQHPFCL